MKCCGFSQEKTIIPDIILRNTLNKDNSETDFSLESVNNETLFDEARALVNMGGGKRSSEESNYLWQICATLNKQRGYSTTRIAETIGLSAPHVQKRVKEWVDGGGNLGGMYKKEGTGSKKDIDERVIDQAFEQFKSTVIKDLKHETRELYEKKFKFATKVHALKPTLFNKTKDVEKLAIYFCDMVDKGNTEIPSKDTKIKELYGKLENAARKLEVAEEAMENMEIELQSSKDNLDKADKALRYRNKEVRTLNQFLSKHREGIEYLQSKTSEMLKNMQNMYNDLYLKHMELMEIHSQLLKKMVEGKSDVN